MTAAGKPQRKRARSGFAGVEADAGKPGLGSRKAATRLLAAVVDRQASLDGLMDQTGGNPHFLALTDQDRLLVRAIVLAALRHRQVIDAFIDELTERPLPAGAQPLRHVLAVAAAQILYLDVPDRAAVDLAVSQASGDPRNRRFAGLVNAVLRRMVREKSEILPRLSSSVVPYPAWFADRIGEIYGLAKATMIMAAMQMPPGLDLTVKSDPDLWAARLGGIVLPNGSVRLPRLDGPVSGLPGYDDGAWWVQDAAASIPARMFSELAGKRVADLCAAPGGKTAQLILAGAEVTAFDQSASRLERLKGNLERLALKAELRQARAQDVADEAGFDCILLDAPCSSTGTVRRHPDIPWTKSRQEISRLALLQRDLLEAATRLLRPDGELVFSNCSIDPEEGEDMVAGFLADNPLWRIKPVSRHVCRGFEQAITADGAIRTDACMYPHIEPTLSGLDGFYAVVLTRRTT